MRKVVRGRWRYDPETGKLLTIEEHNRKYGQRQVRSHLPCPMLIADHMEPVKSMLDGQMYDSKSALRRTYKAAGVTEVGDDPSVTDPKPFRKPRPKRDDIKASVARAFSKAGLGA